MKLINMGSRNPYLQDDARFPGQKYQLVIVDEEGEEHVIDVEPARLPLSEHGSPGSILDICLGNGIELDHACGGVCACATCHVHVVEGESSCGEASEAEEDELEEAYDLKPNSRLGCQCVPDGTSRVKIRVPSWNRNLAREAHSAESMTTKPKE